ncbi:MAG: DUF1730 domain-containing protein, partial [Firmicutes bacterium]|nr:DUF1730 domain-containing protein [Bacillota bacterium]
MENIKELILKYAEDNGLAAGITNAEPFMSTYYFIERTAALKGFVQQNIDKRLDPKKTMPEAKSIIVLAQSYNRKSSFKPDGEKRLRISLAAVGKDYHDSLKAHFCTLAELIKEKTGDFKHKCFVDTGALDERALAVRAGLGEIGTNGGVINPKLGGMINLGYMLTDLELAPDKELKDLNFCIASLGCNECEFCRWCGAQFPLPCGDCMRACPTGAITNRHGSFDFTKCISYITQKPGELSEWEQEAIGTYIYGCDICQRVCRHNIDRAIGEITDIDSILPKAEEILAMNEEDFKKRFEGTAIYWRGLDIIKRNAGYALKNLEKRRGAKE